MWRSGNQELKEQREMKHAKTEIPITKLVGNSGQIPGVPKNPRTWTQGMESEAEKPQIDLSAEDIEIIKKLSE